MRCARMRLLASIAAGLAVALAGSAGALPLIDSSGGTIPYDNGLGTSGTITYLGFETASAVTGIVDTVGLIYATDIVLLFKATPAVGVIDSIGVNAVTTFSVPFSSGAGLGPGRHPRYELCRHRQLLG